VGQKLKKARVAKGLSLEEISKVTKLSEKSLVSIENDQFQDLPAPTYIKGFIKLYAQCVGLDANSILEDFRKNQVSETKQVLILEGEKIEAPSVWQLILSSLKSSLETFWVFALKNLMIAFGHLKKLPLKIWAAVGGMFLLIFIIAQFFKPEPPKAPIVQNVVNTNQPTVTSSSLIRPEMTSETQVSIKQVSDPIRSSNVSTVNTASNPSVGAALTLVGQVKETVWLRVHCDKRLVFEGTLKKGSRETWNAQEYFLLRIGNADAVQFTLNGKALGRMVPPGKIRDIRLTKDGWYVAD
jgi:cytoskeletal protein RodZ